MKGFFKNVILLLSSGSCGAYIAMRNQELSPEGGVYEVLRRLSADDFVCGGITEIKGSQNCPTIDSLARFAVHQHNNNKNAILESVKMVPQEKEFVKVVSAKQQLVAGMLYYITLEAKVGEKVNVYEAKVWERPWLKLKELTEFKFVGEAPPPSVDSTNRNFFIDFFKF